MLECELIKKKKRIIHSLAEGVSAWTGGVEGIKDGKKKDRRDRSVWRGERCVGRFSQLPTLLWILRFKGLVFFLALRDTRQKKKNNAMNKLRETRENLSWEEISECVCFCYQANVFYRIRPWSYLAFKWCLAFLYLFLKDKYES